MATKLPIANNIVPSLRVCVYEEGCNVFLEESLPVIWHSIIFSSGVGSWLLQSHKVTIREATSVDVLAANLSFHDRSMSEQLPPLVSHESLRIITAAAQVMTSYTHPKSCLKTPGIGRRTPSCSNQPTSSTTVKNVEASSRLFCRLTVAEKSCSHRRGWQPLSFAHGCALCLSSARVLIAILLIEGVHELTAVC